MLNHAEHSPICLTIDRPGEDILGPHIKVTSQLFSHLYYICTSFSRLYISFIMISRGAQDLSQYSGHQKIWKSTIPLFPRGFDDPSMTASGLEPNPKPKPQHEQRTGFSSWSGISIVVLIWNQTLCCEPYMGKRACSCNGDSITALIRKPCSESPPLALLSTHRTVWMR
jgi:hypothetical protein